MATRRAPARAYASMPIGGSARVLRDSAGSVFAHVGNSSRRGAAVFSVGNTGTVLYGDLSDDSNTIPKTSVVNLEAKFPVFFCCGPKIRAAMYIWFLNLICFLVHASFTVWTLVAAYGGDGIQRLDVVIYRIQARWTSTEANNFALELVPNDFALNLGWITAGFFLISATFHLIACVLGAHPATYKFYWAYLDDAIAPWRWIEYLASASLMALGIAVNCGIREQYALTSIFVLHAVTMAMGFLCEVYSRPKMKCENGNPTGQKEWSSSYVVRMLPHVLGYVPMIAAWGIIISHFETSKADAAAAGVEVQIPAYVNAAIYGTIVLFFSFGFVQAVFQYMKPGLYWGTEVMYCILSLAAKTFLGSLLLVNVIMVDSGAAEE